ncbi:MAG: cysteine--tRNA ligase [Sulfobacillus sp.]
MNTFRSDFGQEKFGNATGTGTGIGTGTEDLPQLFLRDSITGREKPLPRDRPIRWWSCGPTVYSDAHLGHARNYVVNDVLGRVMTHLGYRWELVMNITDVDDKIICRAREVGQPFGMVARDFEETFWKDMDELNVRRADRVFRVTESMGAIIDFISALLEKNWAYENAGSVYFDNRRFAAEHPSFGFGLCSRLGYPEADSEPSEGGKKCPKDFALWKSAVKTKTRSKPGDPESPGSRSELDGADFLESFPSPWGPGRPGWHVECSAMSFAAFGPQFDLHTGGIDLMFPHHENELRQNLARDPDSRIGHFFHVGHLSVKGKKMSKSLKNFEPVRETLAWHSADEVRMLFLLHEHHHPMDYRGDRDFDEPCAHLRALRIAVTRGMHGEVMPAPGHVMDSWERVQEVARGFLAHFDTRGAVLAMTSFARGLSKVPAAVVGAVTVPLQKWFREVLGISLEMDRDIAVHRPFIELLTEVRDEVRQLARKRKDRSLFVLSDRIRTDLERLGVAVSDGSSGPSEWYIASKRVYPPGAT